MRRFRDAVLLLVGLAGACVGGEAVPRASEQAAPEPAKGTVEPAAAALELPAEPAIEDESWPIYPDSHRQRFDDGYSALSRVGDGWSLALYSPAVAQPLDRLRSKFPPSDPVFAPVEYDVDDRVLLRVPASNSGAAFVIVHTDGMSGDPGFYSIRTRDGKLGDIIWGEALALISADSAMLYQRTNSLFGRRRVLRVSDGILEVVTQEREPVDLRSVVLGPIALRRGQADTTVVARLSVGDSIHVLEATRVEGYGGPLFLVRTSAGVEGWVRLDGRQCPAAVIRGICFYGD